MTPERVSGLAPLRCAARHSGALLSQHPLRSADGRATRVGDGTTLRGKRPPSDIIPVVSAIRTAALTRHVHP